MKLKKSIKIIISIILLLLPFYFISINEIKEVITQINMKFIIISFIAIVLSIIFNTATIKILLDIKKEIAFKELYKYSMYTWAASQFLPSKMGTFSLVYFLKKRDISWKISSSMILANQIITLAMIIPLGIIGILRYIPSKSAVLMIILGGIMVGIGGVIIGIQYLPQKYKEIGETFKEVIHYPKKIGANFLTTLLGFLIVGFCLYLMFIFLGASISLTTVILTSAIITMIGLIPISLNGLGVQEVSAVFLFSLANVPAKITLGVYVTYRIMKYIIASIILLYCLNKKEGYKR